MNVPSNALIGCKKLSPELTLAREKLYHFLSATLTEVIKNEPDNLPIHIQACIIILL
jgi:hypothetical protein